MQSLSGLESVAPLVGAIVVFLLALPIVAAFEGERPTPVTRPGSWAASRPNLRKVQTHSTYHVLDTMIESTRAELWPIQDPLRDAIARGDQAEAWRLHLQARAIFERLYDLRTARAEFAVGAGYRPGR